MNFLKKSILTLLCGGIIFSSAQAQTTARAEDIFKKWFEWQGVMPDLDLTTMSHTLDDNFVLNFKKNYESLAPQLSLLTPLLSFVTAGHINTLGYYLKTPITKELMENLSVVYQLMQVDMPRFVDMMKKGNLVTPENLAAEEAGDKSSDTIEKYNAFFRLLFTNSQEPIAQQYLFSVANRFYEYCFSPESFPDFRRILLNKNLYSVARMLYAVTWFNLAGNGWKHWNEESLKTLKTRAQEGYSFVYIAGGSDLYQLIKAGIYNIKNIDPQLPSQPKYYANEWQFILKGQGSDGGIGDKIIFTFPDRTVTMERTGFQELGTTFKARIATGDVIELPHSVTTWTFFDADNKELGKYVLERRFCEQADFGYEPNKTLLMSFNELYFIALPSVIGGWNIDPSRFDEKLSIVIKQLRKPVSKDTVVNMRVAALLNATDFKFIALGTCIN